MMSEVLQYMYLIMITCILIRVSSKEVKWTVRDTSIKLGQDLTLFCEVDNCTVHETKRWHGGPDDKVLMLYNGISTNKAKYSTSIEKNGFILTILNLTVKDLNVSYECSCGVDSDKHSLHIEDVDTDTTTLSTYQELTPPGTTTLSTYQELTPPVDNLNKTTNGTSYIGTNDVDEIPWYVLLIIIAVILIVLIIAIVIKRHWLWRKLKEKIYGPQGIDSGSSLTTVPVVFIKRKSADEVDSQNVTDPLLETTHVDSNPRQSAGSSLQSADVNLNQIQCTDEVDTQNETDPLLHTIPVDFNQRKSAGSSIQSADVNLNQIKCTDEVDSQNVTDPLLETTHVDSNPRQSAESFEPSTSGEASSDSQRTSSSITGTERKESLETNPNTPDSSFQYSNNHRDVSASTCPGKRHMEYANIKLREKSFKTWPLKKPTILQLAKAGFFHSGYKNIAECFSCGNKIPWEEDWNPLDEVFHHNCEHLRQITSTQLKTAYSPDQ